MARVDRRKLEKLEARQIKVGGKYSTSDSLEEYFKALENYQAEMRGLPPPHDIQEKYDPVLEEYFADLREQEAARNAALQRKEQNG
jgi:hypothetical protein